MVQANISKLLQRGNLFASFFGAWPARGPFFTNPLRARRQVEGNRLAGDTQANQADVSTYEGAHVGHTVDVATFFWAGPKTDVNTFSRRPPATHSAVSAKPPGQRQHLFDVTTF